MEHDVYAGLPRSQPGRQPQRQQKPLMRAAGASRCCWQQQQEGQTCCPCRPSLPLQHPQSRCTYKMGGIEGGGRDEWNGVPAVVLLRQRPVTSSHACQGGNRWCGMPPPHLRCQVPIFPTPSHTGSLQPPGRARWPCAVRAAALHIPLVMRHARGCTTHAAAPLDRPCKPEKPWAAATPPGAPLPARPPAPEPP